MAGRRPGPPFRRRPKADPRLKDGAAIRTEGMVKRVRYETDDGEFQVVVIEPDGGGEFPVIVRGAAVEAGERLRVEGEVKRHKSGELQIDSQSAVRILPTTADGIRSYLASGGIHGIGPKLADEIVDRFGDKTLDVLDTQPDRLRGVPGIGKKRLAEIKKRWKESRAVRDVMIFLQSRDISPAYATRVYKTYGDKAVAIVQRDPYRLARDIRGIGFQKADRVAAAGGIDGRDPRRVRAGVLYALDVASDDGHVFGPRGGLREQTAALLQVPEEDVESAIDALARDASVRVEGDGDEAAVYATERFEIERELAERLLLQCARRTRVPRVSADALSAIEKRLSLALAPSQRAALHAITGESVAVLTGGPGTGKTTIVRALVEHAVAHGMSVELAAPTGRAAQRLGESTRRAARTIHRLLEFNPREGGFQRDAEKPLSCDLLVIDEASMLDQSLALAVVQALGAHTAVVFVGDVEQLPSVGPGDVLDDVIRSGAVPVARLDEVFRQAASSRIVACAHAIRRGELIAPSKSATGDFFFVRADDPESIAVRVQELVCERIPKAFSLSAKEDVQVLAPMRSGPVGTQTLNELLQHAHGVGGQYLERGRRRLHVGDKVIQVRNNYDLDVFNGDIGLVLRLDLENVRAQVRFGERLVVYEGAALDDLELAYAITVHKSQGSEFPAVVLVLATHHFKLLQRPLLYTAVTRAKERLVIVGSHRALKMAVDSISGVDRFTRLDARLRP